ncbi:nucleoside-diphosphate-sugar epimerase [Deinococcus metalli]|nr:NAD(P)-dependent oxidoreductase [Deinococcus metalli]MBB5375778.1 nucleoside-diphosphate-sugar epimerase [Deinococcus metalli]
MEDLPGMRVFVTGATGHLGRAAVRAFVEAGCTTAVLVRPDRERGASLPEWPELTVIGGDLHDVAAFAPALHAFAPDVVVHLAWFGVGNGLHDDPRQVHQNLTGSLELLEASASAGARTFVGLGSQAEYGLPGGVLTEELLLEPITLYGAVKASVGLVGARLASSLGLRFVWLRLLATYGPFDDPRHLIPFVIDEYLAGRVPELTAGEQLWDYLYVDDAARALVRVAQSQRAQGIFNLASGTSRTVASVVTAIRDLIGPELPLGLGARPYASNQIMRLEADISRLSGATGWAPTTTLEAGLVQTLAWHRAQHSAAGQAGPHSLF